MQYLLSIRCLRTRISSRKGYQFLFFFLFTCMRLLIKFFTSNYEVITLSLSHIKRLIFSDDKSIRTLFQILSLFVYILQYFHYKLRNVTNDIVNMTIITDPTELQRSYEGWLTITGGISCLFGSLFNFLTTERFHLKILSLNNRIYFSINH